MIWRMECKMYSKTPLNRVQLFPTNLIYTFPSTFFFTVSIEISRVFPQIYSYRIAHIAGQNQFHSHFFFAPNQKKKWNIHIFTLNEMSI